ncbi:ABC transporter permease subunit [Proteiniborus sp.]|uniref:ABC transporter permease n=1 Tax=Proteiniborus sp. TaxID=2079015 RepID=UPI003320EF80
MNPVLKKELKTRMRTWRTPVMISLYVLVLSLLVLLVFADMIFSYNGSRGMRLDNVKEMFFVFTIFQLLLLIFIVPATTAGSISGERERSTLELLICTRMSSISIILGKLFSSLAEVIILLIASIPVMSTFFIFGGVSPGNIILIFGFYFVTAILFGSIGIFMSAFFKKTSTSTVASYMMALFLLGGTFFIVLLTRVFYYLPKGLSITQTFPVILYANPFSGLGSILFKMMGTDILGGFIGRGVVGNQLMPLYINLAFDLVVSAILLYLSSLKINPMTKLGGKIKKKRATKKSK